METFRKICQNTGFLWLIHSLIRIGPKILPYKSIREYGSQGKLHSDIFYAMCTSITLHKKWSFPLMISPVNVTKSAVFTKFLKANAGWSSLCVRWNSISIQYKVKWFYLRNLIISLTHGTRNTNLMFDKTNIIELECCIYLNQMAIICSKLTIETVEQSVKYVQS